VCAWLYVHTQLFHQCPFRLCSDSIHNQQLKVVDLSDNNFFND
jgi:hypothetical protein